jgi:hypothetical protein
MVRRLCAFLLVVVVGAGLLPEAVARPSRQQKLPNLPFRDTYPTSTAAFTPSLSKPSPYRFDDYVGTIDTAGTTYWDLQHNGTCGRMIDVDTSGTVSLAWTNGLTDSPGGPRHVYTNTWVRLFGDFAYGSSGIRIDNSQRAGYICQTILLDNWFCFAFHEMTDASGAHAALALGSLISEPQWENEDGLEVVWPKIDAGINGTLHLISAELPPVFPGVPMRIFYSRGTPVFDPDGFPADLQWHDFGGGDFELWDTVMVISADVACSRHSERCAIAWCHSMDDLNNPQSRSQINNEIYLRMSEDGGLNWGEAVNVTQWTPWDPDCYYSGGDPLACDRDTLRCYTDLSILFDDSDNLHIAFTTTGFWWYLPGESDSGWSDATKSMIYHWSEATMYCSLVANGWYDGYEPGEWQRNVQRPSLAVDPQTDYLYCSYMQFDTTTVSENGFPMTDAFVSVSTNGGTNWAVGTNVTNTTPDVHPVATGESMHERDVTVAPLVTDGLLHMEYVLDKDAGSIVFWEGAPTLNPVIYQRIPVESIATAPLLDNYPMHFDSGGFPPWNTAGAARFLPQQFVLHQNYPNPFNATTTIQFDLASASRVTLKIYNVLGQEVLALLNDAAFDAGTHKISVNGLQLPSGIYIYRLETGGSAVSRKMVLLK